MQDLVADAVKQSDGRWQAINRRLNGEVVWTSNRIHQTKRAAVVEAHGELKSGRGKAEKLIKAWDESGEPKTSAYYRILGVAVGQ